ncbi:MAG: tail sheath stabilizer and completion protein [Proteobacteria bacterium]|nr:tail sheath stabilizer and completion protein [Pseudomonadota bacterium]
MLHFYDGQIRKFLTQFIRVLSNFSVETGKGKDGAVTLRAVPVVYGDPTRQVANIIRNNSENALQYAPRIAAYVRELNYDRERMQNPYHIEKQHLKERDVLDDGTYADNKLGAGYTIEKVMPSPFRLEVTADIWTTNTDQKLQIMEQILYLFNPDFEIQKTDNYIDWTSLSYVELTSTTFSSRTIPIGADTEIDIATINFSMPIWLSPPVKVSKLGVIQKIIMSIYDDDGGITSGLIDGTLLTRSYITPNNFGLLVTGNQLRLLGSTGTTTTSTEPGIGTGGSGYYTGANEPSNFDPYETFGPAINWKVLLDQYGKVRNDTSQIRLMQPNGNEIIGTIAVNSLEDTILLFNIDQDTIPANTLTAVKKIINPATFDPGTPVNADRYLIINDVGDSTASVQSSTWGALIATVGDVIEYNSSQSKWLKVFDASHPDSTQHYITNSHTGIQYRFNGTEWVKSYEGIYTAGNWSIVLDGGATTGYNASDDATTP